VTVKVLRLQSVQIRVLLGKGGGTIRDIIAKTGADIKIDHSKRDDPEGDVTIIGNVEKTEAVIREVLATKGCPLIPPEGTAPEIPPEEEDLVVAPNLVGLFIGKGGESVRVMREKVGGAIFIGVQPPTGPGIPQRIQIVGDNREKAKEIVREKLAEINAFAERLLEEKLKGKSGGKGRGRGKQNVKGKSGNPKGGMTGAMMDAPCWDMTGWGPDWDTMGYDQSWDMGWGMSNGPGWDMWGMGSDSTGWNTSAWNSMGSDASAPWQGPAAGQGSGKGSNVMGSSSIGGKWMGGWSMPATMTSKGGTACSMPAIMDEASMDPSMGFGKGPGMGMAPGIGPGICQGMGGEAVGGFGSDTGAWNDWHH